MRLPCSMTSRLGATPSIRMSTPDISDAPEPIEGSHSLGAFVPDAGAIDRLANAFFKGLTSGAPLGPPAVPASPPAPWSAPAPPSTSVAASAIPVQPPFGAPDIPMNGVPSSVPLRSFGGASAGSVAPFAFPQSRSLAPAASQTAIAAPRVDPLGSLPLQDATVAAAPSGVLGGAPPGAPETAAPVQPPLGAVDIPTSGIPSAKPFGSFGGAPVGYASP